MCDLIKFIIYSIKKDTNEESLAKLFMEKFVLSFGMVVVVVVESVS